MIPDHRVTVDGDGIARQPGVHFGGRKQQPKLVKRIGVYALFHLPGGTFWDGAHHIHNPTTFELVRLSGVKEGEGVAFDARIVRPIERREPGHKWQSAKRELLERLAGLMDKSGE